jgi:hypothetical protein
MELAGTMIGAAGEYTISAVIQRSEGGRFVCMARAFDHPDPSKSLPSGTTPRHTVWAEGGTIEEASRALEGTLAARLGPLDWVRWRLTDEQQGRRN